MSYGVFPNIKHALEYLNGPDKHGEFRWKAIVAVQRDPVASLYFIMYGEYSEDERIEFLLGIAMEPHFLRYLVDTQFKFSEEEIQMVKKRLNFI